MKLNVLTTLFVFDVGFRLSPSCSFRSSLAKLGKSLISVLLTDLHSVFFRYLDKQTAVKGTAHEGGIGFQWMPEMGEISLLSLSHTFVATRCLGCLNP